MSDAANLENKVKEISDAVFADTYGIDRKFIHENDQRMKIMNQTISNTLSRYGLYDRNRGSNPIEELSTVVNKSVRRNLLPSESSISKEDPMGGGIRSITTVGNMDANEIELINNNAVLYQNFFTLAKEYKNVVKLIPEVDRVIKIIVRDILNPSEITKRIFNHIYDENKELSVTEEQAGKINKRLQEEVIDVNNLERRFKKWVYESAISGCKPVAVIPYSHILKQIQEVSNLDSNQMRSRITEIFSSEDHKFKVFLNDDEAKKVGELSFESSFSELPEPDKDVMLIELLDDETVDNYYNMCLDIENEHFKSYENEIYSAESIFSKEGDEKQDKFKIYTAEREGWKNKLKTVSEDDRRKKLREQLKTLVAAIDDGILVVKPESSLIIEAQRRIKQHDRYDALKPASVTLGDGFDLLEKRAEKKKEENETDQDLKKFFGDELVNKDVSIMREALMVEYSPDTVIPINMNGQYVGFYAIETESLYGPEYKNRRRMSSFTDFISSTGYRSDKDMVQGAGPMMTGSSADPLDSSAFSPMTIFNYNAYKYTSQGGTSQDNLINETMKMMVLRILSKRLKDPELIKNKGFKDAIMQLLRNDYIVRKQVMFTFIPPEYMVYMTYGEDEDYIPTSIMDGTLLFSYMYLASVVSSLMIKLLKSSDKEKFVYNVGMTKDVGLGIAEIQRNLSTRSIYSQNLFNNAASVLKNSGIYQRLVIPAFKGEQLYDVTQLERMNNLDPDDTFTDRLLQSVLQKMGVSPALLSTMDDADFARTVMQRNMEYRNTIVELQPRYEEYAKKLITLLTRFSNLSKVKEQYKSKDDKKDADNQAKKDEEFDLRINLDNIDPHFTPPMYLTMGTISESIDTANQTIDAILKAYNLDQTTPGINEQKAKIVRRKLIKEFVNNIDWTGIDEIVKSSEAEASVEFAREKKEPKITDRIENAGDNEVAGADQGGFGDMGGDMGGGFGGDMGGGMGGDQGMGGDMGGMGGPQDAMGGGLGGDAQM